MKVPEKSLQFGENPRLYGRIGVPDSPRGLVVFSHPHPQFGGTMSNNVVRNGCHDLRQAGFATLRYDFRGAGKSEGAFDDGVGEQEDLLSAIAVAQAEVACDCPLILAGYSFGSAITWAVLDRVEAVRAVVLISPPFGMLEYDWPARPELGASVAAFIGDQDHICPPSVFSARVGRLHPTIESRIFPGVDHFWQGVEDDLNAQIIASLAKALG